MRASIYFALLALPVIGGSLAGCQDSAYCFNDCGEGGQGGSAGVNGGGTAGTPGAGGSLQLGGSAGAAGSISVVGGSAGVGGCVATTNPAEICDGLDNNCNGVVDDVPAEELTKVTSCGSCENNCLSKILGATPSSITCTSGTCGYTSCTTGFYDADGDKTNGCEYACTPSASPTEVCDGLDNDCDGKKDEDTDFCSPSSCGSCQPCPVGDYLHTVLTCAKIDATKDCRAGDQANAQCAIGACLDGYIDRNGNPLDGCEFQCTPTADKTEICDGLDNDCDGLIDAEDPDLTDVAGTPDADKLGTSCFGDPDGECAKPGREGVRACVNAQKVCSGANVRTENQVAETCNNLDDDCDGTIDDTPTDAGSICGGNNGVSVGLCLASVLTCISGKLECPGAVAPDPSGDACDGSDNDCDDIIDGTRQSPDKTCATDAECDDGDPATVEGCLPRASNPTQKLCAFLPKVPQPVGSDCMVPTPVTQPPGTTAVSGCKKGAWACQGGSPVCAGAVEATPAAVDSCNIDRNCDGTYDGVVLDFSSDSQNCGACGNVCTPPPGSNQLYVCQDSKCVAAAGGTCLPGYQTCQADKPCGYACVKTSNTEICNGIDDDCNCVVDDNVSNPPAPTAVCGTAAAATDNNCKPKTAGNPNGVSVVCQNAAWRCQFGAPGYCDPDNNPSTPASCAAAADPCDGKDNNCNGQADDAFLVGQSGLGQPCASDDGKPAPGDGACRRTGTYVCNSNGTGTQCNAVKGACSENPGGCEEVCDGLDNDCDGSIDETFKAKGSNTAYYLKPTSVRIKNGAGNAGTFMFAYEASRPSADEGNNGSGNGYSTNPPSGVAADRTLSCSRASVLPWSDVTPREAAQTCGLAGGRLCTLNEWQRTCRVNNNDGSGPNTPDTDNACTYGFGPVAACKSEPDATNRVCNIGAFDYDPNTDGDQDGPLPTASSKLKACYADWGSYNGGVNQRAYDITGNLREISICQNDRAVCTTTGDTAACANTCCSGTSTATSVASTRVCGAAVASPNRRLAGQACTATSQCCNSDLNCTADGVCNNDVTGNNRFCGNTGAPAVSCRGVGVACTADNQCCGGERCQGGLCGGAGTLPGATYPLLGGSFATDANSGLTCDFDFYKVAGGFQLYDTGFRCCFDSDPTKLGAGRPPAPARSAGVPR